MKKTCLTLIVARDRFGVIGKNGKLPWHIPEDLLFFKKVTMGWPVIMGRKTFESIGKPLVGRINIVLSRQLINIAGCVVMPSIESALAYSKTWQECFVIGGSELFRSMFDYVDRLLITQIDAVFCGDSYFRFIPDDEWILESKCQKKTAPPNNFLITFVEYIRISSCKRA